MNLPLQFQGLSSRFAKLCGHAADQMQTISGERDALAEELATMKRAGGTDTSPPDIRALESERDELAKKYNLLVVALALERGRRVQCQREVDEYKRVFHTSVLCMVRSGCPFHKNANGKQ